MKFFKASIILCLIFISLGCATNKYIYDKKVSEDQLCELTIPEKITVIQFDDKKVKWNLRYNVFRAYYFYYYPRIFSYHFSLKKDVAHVKIPEGKHTLIVDYSNAAGIQNWFKTNKMTTRKVDGIEITKEFLHGKTYSLWFLVLGDEVSIFINEKDEIKKRKKK